MNSPSPNAQDKSFAALLELGNPAGRGSRSELLDRASRIALTLMDADAVAALVVAPRRAERMVLHAGSAASAALPFPQRGSEVVRRFAEAWQPLALADLSEEPAVSDSDGCPGVGAGPALFAPIRQHGQAPGYVAAYRRRGRARFTAAEIRQMLLLGAWLAMALESQRLASGSEKLAVSDEQTEVYNHRFLEKALKREIRRASRHGQELSLVRVEVDPEEGSGGPGRAAPPLRELATVLSQQVRSFDVLARSGSGFVVLLPQTGRDGAAEVAERMRAAVEQHAFDGAPQGAVTISLGVASFPRDGSDAEDLTATASRALHRARQRRNCVAALTSRAA